MIGPWGHRQIGCCGAARHVDIAGEVGPDPKAGGGAGAPRDSGASKIGRVNQPAASGIQLGDKGVRFSLARRLKGAWGCGEVDRGCAAGHIGVPGGVHGNFRSKFLGIIGVSAEVGGIQQLVPSGIQLGHKGAVTRIAELVVRSVVKGSLVSCLVSSLGGRKTFTRVACEKDVTACIHSYAPDRG